MAGTPARKLVSVSMCLLSFLKPGHQAIFTQACACVAATALYSGVGGGDQRTHHPSVFVEACNNYGGHLEGNAFLVTLLSSMRSILVQSDCLSCSIQLWLKKLPFWLHGSEQVFSHPGGTSDRFDC